MAKVKDMTELSAASELVEDIGQLCLALTFQEEATKAAKDLFEQRYKLCTAAKTIVSNKYLNTTEDNPGKLLTGFLRLQRSYLSQIRSVRDLLKNADNQSVAETLDRLKFNVNLLGEIVTGKAPKELLETISHGAEAIMGLYDTARTR